MRISILTLAFAVFSSFTALTQSSKPNLDVAVDKIAKSFMSNPEHIGLSIGIINHGVRYMYNYGTVEKGKDEKPNAQTIYEIASITKSFTGILLAHAILEKKIHLDDEIVKFIPSLSNLTYQGNKVTIRNLTNHTSGLPKFVPVPPKDSSFVKYWLTNGEISEMEFLNNLALFKLELRPGSKFVYSNADTQLLGIILERVYHMSYSDLIKKYITGPANMHDTKIFISQSNESRLAKGYDSQGALAPRMTWWNRIPAATALKSSVADMINYLQLNLNEQDPAIRLAHKPILKIEEEGADSIGMYWMNKKSKSGYTEVFHAGGSAGQTSFCLIIPKANKGIICIVNDASADTESELKKMSYNIMDLIN